MYKLLLIDDNPEIQQANRDYLVDKGYKVDTANTGIEALAKLKSNTYDCVLLDVLLPDLDGYAICTEARKTVATPIIFLSCMSREDYRIKGLLLGGDDYMVKPYDLDELGTRVFAQIRRNRMPQDAGKPYTTNVMVDEKRRTVVINGTNILLSKKEFEVLTLLMEQKGEAISAEEIKRRVWPEEADSDGASVRVYIQRIREKLGPDLGRIDNNYGNGYCYLPPDEAMI